MAGRCAGAASFAEVGYAHARLAYGLAVRPRVLPLDGPAGLGKSGLAEEIQRHLIRIFTSDAAIVRTDSYFLFERPARRAAGVNGNDPAAMRLVDLRADLGRLCAGEAISVRDYDHATGLFEPAHEIAPAPIILVDGIHSLHPVVMGGLFMPVRVFLTASEEENRRLRWKRDVTERGYTLAEWERLWSAEWAAQEAFLTPELGSATAVYERTGDWLVPRGTPEHS